MNSKKHGQPSVVLGQTMSPLPWSLLSLLTKWRTNLYIMEEEWSTEGHPVNTTKQSFKVTTSNQLSVQIRKKDVSGCNICRPVSCIRYSSTPTNDKKADGHDWPHRSMSGDSRPTQQSPLLCTAKEEPMEEPEQRTAARKCLSPVTVQRLY